MNSKIAPTSRWSWRTVDRISDVILDRALDVGLSALGWACAALAITVFIAQAVMAVTS